MGEKEFDVFSMREEKALPSEDIYSPISIMISAVMSSILCHDLFEYIIFTTKISCSGPNRTPKYVLPKILAIATIVFLLAKVSKPDEGHFGVHSG